jgi:antagonist of KipI
MIRVIEPGGFTTVQDLGRPGRANAGVPPSGAMDPRALRVANLLAGNAEDAAALEITMIGPLLTFEDDAIVAIAGAAFEAGLDGEPIPHGASFPVAAGSTLRLARPASGARAYLAVRGGIAVPPILGSSSTLASAGLGGWLGRALAAGDYLRAGAPQPDIPMRRLAAGAMPEATNAVRVVAGPQTDAFTDWGLKVFFSKEFTVSPRSDRAGVRLQGTPLVHSGQADMDPEGVVTGAVQVPGDGMPIILGPDRPVTGGYVKIATVITADLPIIAQARPGDSLLFAEVDVSSARTAWREQEASLERAIEDVP